MREGKPKYLEVVEWVKQQIDTGKLKAGNKIPSENALSNQFGLSRQTVRHAISVLENDEIVYSLRGSGTYISKQADDWNNNRNTIVIMMTYVDGYIFPRTIKGLEDKLFGKEKHNGSLSDIAKDLYSKKIIEEDTFEDLQDTYEFSKNHDYE